MRAARRDVVDASDQERRRLERDLHDGTQQRLVALRFALVSRHRAGGRVAAADAALERALVELRELAHGLYPGSLDTDGLATAIASAVERSPLVIELVALPGTRFAAEIERTAYRVVSDGLGCAQRAGARRARIEATVTEGQLRVRLDHDGRLDGDADLDLLRDRVEAAAGVFRVTDVSVVAEVPCA